ncbi:MAG: trehalose-phosphatase [Candidatus Melainabacteria bacterium]|nr:trehalose-phosphatase [Candidatus Melainabacteria bacterium]
MENSNTNYTDQKINAKVIEDFLPKPWTEIQELTTKKFQELTQDQSKILFCFDYDGTLVDLATENIVSPGKLPAQTANLLNQLIMKQPVAIITGRQLKNLKLLIDDQLDPRIKLFGTHGAEMGEEITDNQYQDQLQSIQAELAQESDIEFEAKQISLTIHYINHPNPEPLLSKLHQLATSFQEIFRIQEGRDFFEFLPKDINKGMAIHHLQSQHPAHYLTYFGDDLTDNYAFEAVNHYGGLSSQVSKRIKASQAGYLINKVSDLHALIASYLEI